MKSKQTGYVASDLCHTHWFNSGNKIFNVFDSKIKLKAKKKKKPEEVEGNVRGERREREEKRLGHSSYALLPLVFVILSMPG